MKKIAVLLFAIVVGVFFGFSFVGCGDYQPCQTDKDCPPPTVCSQLNGKCITSPAGNTNNQNNNNVNNNNQKPQPGGRGQSCNTTADKPCEEGLVCVDGASCGNCQTHEQCRNASGGRQMFCVNGFCRRQCTDANECRFPNQEMCTTSNKVGICQRPECTNDAGCKDGEVCKGLRCVPETCKTDVVCPYGHICDSQQGACVPGCRRDENCQHGQFCSRQFKCTDGCKRDLDCMEGFVCKSSRCEKKDIPQCQSDIDCINAGLTGHICEVVNGPKQCVPGCRSASDLCGGAHLCKKSDPNCTGDECKGTCVPAPCSVDVDCAQGEVCHQRSICVKKPQPEETTTEIPSEVPPTDGGGEPTTEIAPEEPVEECGTDQQCVARNPNKPVCEQRLQSGQNNRCIVCENDQQCVRYGLGQRCQVHASGDNARNVCVECLANTDCKNGRVCRSNKCEPLCTKATQGQVCTTPGKAFCKEETATTPAECVGCVNDDHCKNGRVCKSNLCVPVCTVANQDTTCKAKDPSKPFCKVETQNTPAECVECVVNSHCGSSQKCQNNVCVASCTPSPEVCDGKDNDCDGKIDEDVTDSWAGTACYTGPVGTRNVGVCSDGQFRCVNAQKKCVGETLPSAEVCDQADNNCNGQVDEGLEYKILISPGYCAVQYFGSQYPTHCNTGTTVMEVTVTKCFLTYFSRKPNGAHRQTCPKCYDQTQCSASDFKAGTCCEGVVAKDLTKVGYYRAPSVYGASAQDMKHCTLNVQPSSHNIGIISRSRANFINVQLLTLPVTQKDIDP